MKVLSIVESMSLSQGGPPEVLRNNAKIINKEKKILSILSLSKINIFYFIKCFFFKKEKEKLINFLQKYDIIHIHHLWSLKVIIISHFSEKLAIKVILISHGYLDEWSMNVGFWKKKLFIKFFLQKAVKSSVFFFSTIDEYYEAKKNINFSDFFVIPNGSDLTKYKIIDKPKNIKSLKKIIFFGRIHEKKGIEILLDAIKELPKNFFEKYYFEITGPGEYEYIRKIKSIIKKNFSNDYVKLLEPKTRENKIEYLKTADIFILPSYEEGDSIALKEAMALGMPVIISEQCRMPLVKTKGAGAIVETNVNSIKKSLIELENWDLKKMGSIGRNLIETYFDNKNCSERLLRIYEDIYTGSHNSPDWKVLNE